jgi:methylphosphotriester-DNA--protein-cysteine methyltransferase
MLLAQGTPIMDVVFQAGYYDHPHLTHSLKRFLNQTPVQIASQPH